MAAETGIAYIAGTMANDIKIPTANLLLVLAGDIENNPGPGPLKFGSLNCRSAAPKIALLHDHDNRS